MKIQVLGPGCSKCRKAFEVVEAFVREKGLAHDVVKVEDIEEMLKLGVLSTPAVVIEGKVVLKGRVPRRRDLEKLIK